ncbi:MAG: hypothetical protein HDR04_13835 [Lachnospiraceae bacterium]|nr:hypothetical protein [Lachnospiraceae bacterium]
MQTKGNIEATGTVSMQSVRIALITGRIFAATDLIVSQADWDMIEKLEGKNADYE